MLKFISMKPFIIALSIGLILNLLTVPTPNIIHIYPTPDNYNKIQFKDSSGTCFGIDSKEVKCPYNKKDISKIPFQQTQKSY